MRRTAEETAQTRAALLEAALFTFSEQGVTATRLADVAERAGLTRGALYHHFDDKTALYTAVVAHCWESLTSPVWETLDSPGTTMERLGRFLLEWLRRLRHDDRFRALLTITVNADAALASMPDAAAGKAYGLGDWRDRLHALLSEADQAGELRDGTDPAHAATNLIAWLCGTALLAATDIGLLPAGDAAGVAPILRGLQT